MVPVPPASAHYASPEVVRYLRSCLRTVVDFPKPSIRFKDITPLLADPVALQLTLDLLAQPYLGANIDAVAAIEARGFVFGAALAARLKCGMLMVRKAGKLPAEVDEVSYSLEYGDNVLQLHKGAVRPGARVLVVDDLLATGGTAAATVALIRKQQGRIAGFAFVCELTFLGGRDKLAALCDDTTILSLIPIAAGE
ncbi:MAG TPA: adenine phosphoribosyltransferase [Sorangium sp.]|nr:adenine phosphoribosyltransferase [Sorangium sp.]